MCECYQIGGPWIAEDPSCPRHGRFAKERQWALSREEAIAILTRFAMATPKHIGEKFVPADWMIDAMQEAAEVTFDKVQES